MKRILIGFAAAISATTAGAAQDINSGNLVVLATAPIGAPRIMAPAPNVVDATAFYSNITGFGGSGTANGGAANQAGNTITRLSCDNTVFDADAIPRSLVGFRFAVANLDVAAVSARPRVRFFQNGAGVPGAFIVGFSFNPIAFAASSITTVSGTVAATALPGTGPGVIIWTCLTFDDNTGATGATLAQMNNLGLGFFNPVDRGSSTDTIFVTTAAGSFLASNPAGALANFGGAPVANFGWELLQSTTFPVQLQSFSVD